MAEQACDQSSEESLNPQEPQDASPTTPQKVKKVKNPRRFSHSKHRDILAIYFPKVLKHIHSGLILSRSTVSVLDSFVKDMFQRITNEAGSLAGQNHRSTITSRDIQVAVGLLLPGEIFKHAVYEATRALSRSHPRQ
uniref:late histone H2B.L4-like n=1 Tax=Ictidomys tridecemlineatus TaxID=43179 RepID=UPI001A9E9AB3|nr:late histone H2B.L4-like [Ictidomys tridecemlineatus]XP_040144751.1 late histone H2B.L4-like [Ictidomys tridecemlineatus]